jgi:hypothetical protein
VSTSFCQRSARLVASGSLGVVCVRLGRPLLPRRCGRFELDAWSACVSYGAPGNVLDGSSHLYALRGCGEARLLSLLLYLKT